MLAITALALVWLRDLIAVVMLSGIYSLLSAGLFMTLQAPDVALTEAAVGAGVATVFLLGALMLTGVRNTDPARHRPWIPLVVVCVTGAALIYGTMDMPLLGNPDNPVQTHVGPRYIEESPIEIGIPNMVASVLASYRGFDTLGEVVVVFAAAVGVLLLLSLPRAARRNRDDGDDQP